MAYEPFSLSTRKTRTSLLVFSILSIAITRFNVTINNIPGVGFEIPIPGGFLIFVIGGALIYFTFAFALYVVDDIMVIEKPARSAYIINELYEKIKDKLIHHYMKHDMPPNYENYISDLESISYELNESIMHIEKTRTTRVTSFRVYVFDTALPLGIGLYANHQVWTSVLA